MKNSNVAIVDGVGVSTVDEKDTSKPVQAFISSLFNIVNDDKTNDIVSWSEHGSEFVIHDPKRLASEVRGDFDTAPHSMINRILQVLPKHFRHGNFSSFMRQLNFYW